MAFIGIAALIAEQEDLPFTETGICPDGKN